MTAVRPGAEKDRRTDEDICAEVIVIAFGRGAKLELTRLGDEGWRAEVRNVKGALVSTATRPTRRQAIRAIRAACGRVLPVKLRGERKEVA